MCLMTRESRISQSRPVSGNRDRLERQIMKTHSYPLDNDFCHDYNTLYRNMLNNKK